MEQTVTQLSSRLNKIETEYAVASRRRAEGASRAFKALQEISTEDADLLKGIVPELAVVKTYTEESIAANLNKEVETIRRVAEDLRSYVEHRLTFYEDQL